LIIFLRRYNKYHKHPHLVKKITTIFQEESLKELKLSRYYELLVPLSVLYEKYQPNRWWVDIYEIYVRVILTSVLWAIFDTEKLCILLSFISSIICYKFQSRLSPYLENNQNGFTDFTKVMLAILYFAIYIRSNNSLTEGDFEYVDILLQIVNVSIYVFALVYLVPHFRNKFKAVSTHKIDPVIEGLILEDNKSFSIQIFEGIPMPSLLRIQACIFFSAAPTGTFDKIRKLSKNIDYKNEVLFYVDSVPTSYISNIHHLDTFYSIFPSKDEKFTEILKTQYHMPEEIREKLKALVDLKHLINEDNFNFDMNYNYTGDKDEDNNADSSSDKGYDTSVVSCSSNVKAPRLVQKSIFSFAPAISTVLEDHVNENEDNEIDNGKYEDENEKGYTDQLDLWDQSAQNPVQKSIMKLGDHMNPGLLSIEVSEQISLDEVMYGTFGYINEKIDVDWTRLEGFEDEDEMLEYAGRNNEVGSNLGKI